MSIEDYLNSKKDTKFSWTENNCLSFVVEYLDLDELPLEWFLGHDNEVQCYRAYKKKLRELRYSDIVDAFDDILQAEVTLWPRDGFIVATPASGLVGKVFGLHYKNRNFFLDVDGLKSIPVSPHDLYWSIG